MKKIEIDKMSSRELYRHYSREAQKKKIKAMATGDPLERRAILQEMKKDIMARNFFKPFTTRQVRTTAFDGAGDLIELRGAR